MNLPLFIAFRYLFAKKSHNVINIISAISVIGMAIGTAAVIIIQSIYNGFDDIVKTSLGNVEPDILVVPKHGKTFTPDYHIFDKVKEDKSISYISSVLQENVYISYGSQSGIAKAKGVDSVYEKHSPIASHITEGNFTLRSNEMSFACVGGGLAYKTGINPRFAIPITLYFPARNGRISLSDPTSSVKQIKVFPSGIFITNAEVDNQLIILPIEKMRELLDYTEEVSGIELRLVKNSSAKDLKRVMNLLSKELGSNFKILDRYSQNESLYKMMKYEKASVYLILIFILIIIAFNIFGSLSMLVIEKKGDIQTLRNMGARNSLIRRIFILEGWMISIAGMLIGLVIGLIFIYLQHKFGFIRMPGGFNSAPYPIILQGGDIILTMLFVSVIGYLITLIPSRSIKE